MACVVRDKNGTKRVQFTDGDGERKQIRLGKVSAKAAESFRLRVEALLAAKELHQSPDAELCEWLRDLPERMHERLERVGLVAPRAKAEVVTVAMLLERFTETASVKPSTMAAYRQTTESLREHLGPDTPLAEVTPAHADRWRKAIGEPVTVKAPDGTETTKRLAKATVAKRVHVARAIFKRAARWGLIRSSPFAELKAGSQANPERAYHVPAGWMASIFAACPDDEWRAIIALSRFAALRCPSEVGGLRWADVDWSRMRLTVRSVKNADKANAVRVVPIVPELAPILQALFDAAEPGTEAVTPRLQIEGVNLRTQFERIIERAGLTAWPRLFHNLRASCLTDWAERFPAHAVAKWAGHSPLIGAQHYLQTRDAHFDLATSGTAGIASLTREHDAEKSGAKSGAIVSQHAAQHPSASAGARRPDSSQVPDFARVSRADANERETASRVESGRYRIRTCDLMRVMHAR